MNTMAHRKNLVCFSFVSLLIVFSNSQECTIKQDQCSYKVTVTETKCHGKHHKHGWNLQSDAPEVITKTDGEEHESLKKLEALDRKLTKMMEGLSVRSLRHMRKIRSEMKQMASAIQLMKASAGRKRRPRGVLECPPDFHGFGTWTSCYKFSSFPTMWRTAREYCSALGANLVALETSKEQYVIDYLIKSNKEYQEAKGWWTSGQYIPRSQRWMWTSQHHLKPMDVSSWARGEPDDRSTNHCLILFKPTQYKWNDAQCMDNYNFICELDMGYTAGN